MTGKEAAAAMKTEIKFHNPDNLETAGAPPWRFLVEGEIVQVGDEVWNGGQQWFRSYRCGMLIPEHTYRTKRPLPAPQPGGGGEAEAPVLIGLHGIPEPPCDPDDDNMYRQPGFQLPSMELRQCNYLGCGWVGPYGQSRAEVFWCPKCQRTAPMIHCVPFPAPPTPPIALPVRAEAGTPRTDTMAESLWEIPNEEPNKRIQKAVAFARTLEHEIAALSRELEESREALAKARLEIQTLLSK